MQTTRLMQLELNMKKLLMSVAAAALAITATSFAASAAEKLKVGFIYLGPVGDLGWTYMHELGRQAMVKELGDKVETTFLENVSEGPDSERSIEQLARTGHQLIFTTSFGFMEPTVKVAKKYPKIKFEHATGYKRAENLATYAAKFHEGRYIIGQIAAYSAAVLKSWRRAVWIGGLLTGLYAVLYILLSLEAFSLLIGSLLLFAALAGVMYATRRIDWGAKREPMEAGVTL